MFPYDTATTTTGIPHNKIKSHTYSHRFSVDLWISLQFWMQYTEWHPFLMAISMMRKHLRFSSSMCVSTLDSLLFLWLNNLWGTHTIFVSLFFPFFERTYSGKSTQLDPNRILRNACMRVVNVKIELFFTKCFREIKSFYSPIYLYSSLHYTIRAFLNVCNSYQKIYNWVVSLSLSHSFFFWNFFTISNHINLSRLHFKWIKSDKSIIEQ